MEAADDDAAAALFLSDNESVCSKDLYSILLKYSRIATPLKRITPQAAVQPTERIYADKAAIYILLPMFFGA